MENYSANPGKNLVRAVDGVDYLRIPVKTHLITKDDDMVDVVFLLAVKMNTKFEIRRTKQFYKDFLQLTDNDENMEAIKRMGSTLDIYQYFIK